jgi:hypothetical protein
MKLGLFNQTSMKKSLNDHDPKFLIKHDQKEIISRWNEKYLAGTLKEEKRNYIN